MAERFATRGDAPADLGELGPAEQVTVLLGRTKNGTLRQRKKAAVVLANLRGVPIRTIAACLSISPVSVRKYVRVFTASGLEALFGNGRRTGGRLADSETIRQAVFALLHEPPSAATEREVQDLAGPFGPSGSELRTVK
jgi:transposase